MIKIFNKNSQITHIVHTADIHVRLTKRHCEYDELFDKFYKCIDKTPDTTLIAVLGDLCHNKLDLSPESVQSAQKFLFNCAELRPTILISGNHDAMITNKNRMDSLTPIVNALSHSNLFYLKDSGIYGIGNVLFSVCSVFDPENFVIYDKIPKKYINEYEHHIALYHGVVDGVITDHGHILNNQLVKRDLFDGYHLALLGDIHKAQTLQDFDYENNKPVIRYAGSLIMQNFSEEHYKNGFSLWDLKNRTYKHHELLNDYGFFTVEINKGKLITDLTSIPKKARIHVKCFESIPSEVKEAISEIKKKSDVEEISYSRIESEVDKPTKTQIPVNLLDITNITYQNSLLTEYLKTVCNIIDKNVVDKVLEINNKTNDGIKKEGLSKKIKWKPKKFEFSNMFSYGENNTIDFSKCKSVIGLFGPNTCGKCVDENTQIEIEYNEEEIIKKLGFIPDELK